jgi:hypothetical protein
MTDRPIVAHPHWPAFLAGYQAGLEHGIGIGYAHAGQDWTDVTTAACRTARGGVPHAELDRRRHTYRTAALTAQQIRDRAARSWGLTTPTPTRTTTTTAHTRQQEEAA